MTYVATTVAAPATTISGGTVAVANNAFSGLTKIFIVGESSVPTTRPHLHVPRTVIRLLTLQIESPSHPFGGNVLDAPRINAVGARRPAVSPGAWVAPGATVVGDVSVAEEASVW